MTGEGRGQSCGFFARNQGVAHAAGPRLTSRQEGAFAISPVELIPEYLRHKVHQTTFDAPT